MQRFWVCVLFAVLVLVLKGEELRATETETETDAEIKTETETETKTKTKTTAKADTTARTTQLPAMPKRKETTSPSTKKVRIQIQRKAHTPTHKEVRLKKKPQEQTYDNKAIVKKARAEAGPQVNKENEKERLIRELKKLNVNIKKLKDAVPLASPQGKKIIQQTIRQLEQKKRKLVAKLKKEKPIQGPIGGKAKGASTKRLKKGEVSVRPLVWLKKAKQTKKQLEQKTRVSQYRLKLLRVKIKAARRQALQLPDKQKLKAVKILNTLKKKAKVMSAEIRNNQGKVRKLSKLIGLTKQKVGPRPLQGKKKKFLRIRVKKLPGKVGPGSASNVGRLMRKLRKATAEVKRLRIQQTKLQAQIIKMQLQVAVLPGSKKVVVEQKEEALEEQWAQNESTLSKKVRVVKRLSGQIAVAVKRMMQAATLKSKRLKAKATLIKKKLLAAEAAQRAVATKMRNAPPSEKAMLRNKVKVAKAQVIVLKEKMRQTQKARQKAMALAISTQQKVKKTARVFAKGKGKFLVETLKALSKRMAHITLEIQDTYKRQGKPMPQVVQKTAALIKTDLKTAKQQAKMIKGKVLVKVRKENKKVKAQRFKQLQKALTKANTQVGDLKQQVGQMWSAISKKVSQPITNKMEQMKDDIARLQKAARQIQQTLKIRPVRKKKVSMIIQQKKVLLGLLQGADPALQAAIQKQLSTLPRKGQSTLPVTPIKQVKQTQRLTTTRQTAKTQKQVPLPALVPRPSPIKPPAKRGTVDIESSKKLTGKKKQKKKEIQVKMQKMKMKMKKSKSKSKSKERRKIQKLQKAIEMLRRTMQQVPKKEQKLLDKSIQALLAKQKLLADRMQARAKLLQKKQQFAKTIAALRAASAELPVEEKKRIEQRIEEIRAKKKKLKQQLLYPRKHFLKKSTTDSKGPSSIVKEPKLMSRPTLTPISMTKAKEGKVATTTPPKAQKQDSKHVDSVGRIQRLKKKIQALKAALKIVPNAAKVMLTKQIKQLKEKRLALVKAQKGKSADHSLSLQKKVVLMKALEKIKKKLQVLKALAKVADQSTKKKLAKKVQKLVYFAKKLQKKIAGKTPSKKQAKRAMLEKKLKAAVKKAKTLEDLYEKETQWAMKSPTFKKNVAELKRTIHRTKKKASQLGKIVRKPLGQGKAKGGVARRCLSLQQRLKSSLARMKQLSRQFHEECVKHEKVSSPLARRIGHELKQTVAKATKSVAKIMKAAGSAKRKKQLVNIQQTLQKTQKRLRFLKKASKTAVGPLKKQIASAIKKLQKRRDKLQLKEIEAKIRAQIIKQMPKKPRGQSAPVTGRTALKGGEVQKVERREKKLLQRIQRVKQKMLLIDTHLATILKAYSKADSKKQQRLRLRAQLLLVRMKAVFLVLKSISDELSKIKAKLKTLPRNLTQLCRKYQREIQAGVSTVMILGNTVHNQFKPLQLPANR